MHDIRVFYCFIKVLFYILSMDIDKKNEIFAHIETKFDLWVEELKKLIAIESISFQSGNPDLSVKCANHCKYLLERSGLENVCLLEVENAPPYVYADWLYASNAPTVLLYAHYDVQPPMRDDKWDSPPFEGVVRKNRLYGRGSADDKAAIILHLASIAAFLDNNLKLPVNVKILIEGEEEIGSPNIDRFLSLHKDKLTSDMIIIPDSNNFDTGIPTITTSLRGLVSMELEVQTTLSPLHSGLYGGPLPDPIMELSKIISSLVDNNGKILIPELYKMVKPLEDVEKKNIEKVIVDIPYFSKQIKLLDNVKLKCSEQDLFFKLWREPSLVINSFQSGGRAIAGNVIMDKAWCRLGIRTVADMEPEKTYSLLKAKLESLASEYVSLTIKKDATTSAWCADINNKYLNTKASALSEGFERETVFAGCGATIPFAGIISDALGGIPAILTGVGDPYTNAHSENESLDLNDFKKLIISESLFFMIL